MTEQQDEHIPKAEWAVAVVGLLVVLGALVFLVVQAVAGDQSPPELRVDVVRMIPQSDQHLVEVRVSNIGGTTALQAKVSGRLRVSDGATETKEITIDVVAPHASQKAGLIFRSDPARGELELVAEGYVDP